MKILTLICASVALSAMVACAPKNRPDDNGQSLVETKAGTWLVGSWQGQATDQNPDQAKFKFTVSKNGKYSEEVVKEVGLNGDRDVPSPSVCHYRQTGRVFVARTNEATKAKYKKANKAVPHVGMRYSVTKTELIQDNANSQNCPTFVDRQNKAKNLSFARFLSKKDDKTVVDPDIETTFLKVK